MEDREKHVAKHAKGEPAPRAYSKLVVALCLAAVAAYTATCFVYLWWGKPLNDPLTGFFFACFGMEFASLAFIRRGKLKYAEGNPATRQMPHVEIKEEENGQSEVRKPEVLD